MVKPSFRTRTIGTRVTEEEYADFERHAKANGSTLSEWCREVMLASVNGHLPEAQKFGDSEAPALMAEFLALRTILLNVLFKQANGENLSAQQMQQLIDRADADKLRKAMERLRQGSKSNES